MSEHHTGVRRIGRTARKWPARMAKIKYFGSFWHLCTAVHKVCSVFPGLKICLYVHKRPDNIRKEKTANKRYIQQFTSIRMGKKKWSAVLRTYWDFGDNTITSGELQRTVPKRENSQCVQQLCGEKHLNDVRGQERMARLVGGHRKTTQTTSDN